MVKFTEEASDDDAAPADTKAKSKAYHPTESKVPNGDLVNKTIEQNFKNTVGISWEIQGYYWFWMFLELPFVRLLKVVEIVIR